MATMAARRVHHRVDRNAWSVARALRPRRRPVTGRLILAGTGAFPACLRSAQSTFGTNRGRGLAASCSALPGRKMVMGRSVASSDRKLIGQAAGGPRDETARSGGPRADRTSTGRQTCTMTSRHRVARLADTGTGAASGCPRWTARQQRCSGQDVPWSEGTPPPSCAAQITPASRARVATGRSVARNAWRTRPYSAATARTARYQADRFDGLRMTQPCANARTVVNATSTREDCFEVSRGVPVTPTSAANRHASASAGWSGAASSRNSPPLRSRGASRRSAPPRGSGRPSKSGRHASAPCAPARRAPAFPCGTAARARIRG